MSEEKQEQPPAEATGKALGVLIGQLNRIDEQLSVLRARSEMPPDNRVLRVAVWLLLLGLLGLVLHRLLLLDQQLDRQRARLERQEQSVTQSDQKVEQGLAGLRKDLSKLSTLPETLSAEAASDDRKRQAQTQRKLGRLEQQVADLRKQLGQTSEARDRMATRIHFLDTQNRALLQQNEALGVQLRALARRRVKPTPVAKPSQPSTPAEVARLLKQINGMLALDSRKRRIRLVSASGFESGRFRELYLEERKPEGQLLQRVWAASGQIELHAEHRLLRIKLERCRRSFGPGRKGSGIENRLPRLALELYDVNVKSWKEQAGSWLSVR